MKWLLFHGGASAQAVDRRSHRPQPGLGCGGAQLEQFVRDNCKTVVMNV